MRHVLAALVPILLLTAACHQPESHEPKPAQTTPAQSVAAQIARGGVAYGANCASCHGDAGQGKKGPRLVGAGAFPLDPRPDQKVRKVQFHNALDIAKFVTTSMPPDADDRKKIAESDYWAVLAFALNANGVTLKEPVGPQNAASIVLHP